MLLHVMLPASAQLTFLLHATVPCEGKRLQIALHCQNTYIRTEGEKASAEDSKHLVNRADLSRCYAKDYDVRKQGLHFYQLDWCRRKISWISVTNNVLAL